MYPGGHKNGRLSQLTNHSRGLISRGGAGRQNLQKSSLTLSYFRTYIYIRTKSKNRCDSCTYIYVHGLYDRNMGFLPASNRHFTVSPHELFTCFQSVASISRHVYQVGRKVQFTRSCPLFLASFGKLRLSDHVQFIAWHGIQRRIIWIFCRESEVSG